MNIKQIVFTKKDTAEFIDSEYKAPSSNEVVVKTAFSTISSGTEKANITGNSNISIHSEMDEPVIFPRASGYSSSGIVIDKGDNVKSVEIGDSVAMSWSLHKSVNTLVEDNVIKFNNNDVSMQAAALCHIGTFPLAAIRKTKLEIGESVMVMGLGILGIIGVQLAKVCGAVPVIAVDPAAERREKALRAGADYALDPFEIGFAEKVKRITDGGVNVAIEVTGLGAGLNQCLDCMAKFGRISLLGCTRDKNFTVDYYRKIHGPGIQIIGAHTLARPEHDSYHGYFTQRDDMKSLLKLCALKRINLNELIDEVYSPEACYEIYERLINDKSFPPVVQFDWSGI